MASAQTIERALRERFGSEETILTLAEILAFLKTHQNSHCAAGNPNEKQSQHAAHQNAPLPKGQSRGQTRKERATQGPHNTPATQAPATQAPTTQVPTTQAPTTQAPTTQAPATNAPQKQGKALKAHRQKPKQRPSYAEIAKKAPEKLSQQLQPIKKA